MANKKLALQAVRKLRVRANMHGTATKPRITVARSNRFIFVQAIDDVAGATLVSARNTTSEKGTKTDRAQAVGTLIAEGLKKKHITEAIFDRGAYRYHGRVKAVAEALRSAGIKV